nr:lysoplasmalogenase family protein [uncultured Agathobaculum sp.]
MRSGRVLFLAAETALYLLFIILDLAGHASDTVFLKYTGIALCFLAVLPTIRTTDGRLTALALGLTLAADWPLLILDRHYTVGIMLFCVVQALYLIRLMRWRGSISYPLLAVRLVPLVPLILHASLYTLALLYFANLMCNALEAALFVPRSPRQRLFSIGMLLFICCDLCVGAFHLGFFTPFARYGMWLFYLPAQTLIALSSYAKGDNS